MFRNRTPPPLGVKMRKLGGANLAEKNAEQSVGDFKSTYVHISKLLFKLLCTLCKVRPRHANEMLPRREASGA